jgi:hypothetical protein
MLFFINIKYGKSLMNDLIFLRETYLTRAQAIEYIRSKGHNIASTFLSSQAAKRQGPAYKKLGQNTIYSISDIDSWLSSPEFGKTEGSRGRPRGPSQSPHIVPISSFKKLKASA